MTDTETHLPDALLALRTSIASNKPPLTTTSETPTTDPSTIAASLALATHLQFTHLPPSTPSVLSLSSPTRFESSGTPIDLRSILFAWQNRDLAIPDYIAATQRASEELQAAGNSSAILNLVFSEKLDLITWLEGASDESECIRPLGAEEAARQAGQAADVAMGRQGVGGLEAGVGGVAGVRVDGDGRGEKVIDARLRQIYSGERRMGDRNSVLRGVKPTDFSHIHKFTEPFMSRNRPKPTNGTKAHSSSTNTNGTTSSSSSNIPSSMTPNASLVPSRPKNPNRRLEPIILLSPSASSLLRMSNIKSFLDTGTYTPVDTSTSDAANRLQISRLLPALDPTRPIRFTLVDTIENFKPDYWSRVAAVFTTGQTWQFKGYKWQSPPDLFAHALGVYVGWRGEEVPAMVRSWGRGVVSVAIDKWNPHGSAQSRWRDREVVEGIWAAVEESMRAKGMMREGR